MKFQAKTESKKKVDLMLHLMPFDIWGHVSFDKNNGTS